MKIENIERAVELRNKYTGLHRIAELLRENPSMIVVYKTTSVTSKNECTWDGKVKDELFETIQQRIREIEKEIEKL